MKQSTVFPRILLLAVLAAGALALFIVELAYGAVAIPFDAVIASLLGKNPDSLEYAIVVSTRLPQALTAISASIGLAIGGWLMQTLFKNPLAGPSILGITGGASLGVALLMLGGITLGMQFSGLAGSLSIASAAMGGATLILLLVLLVSSKMKDHVSLLIFGIMLGHFSSALVSILQYKASKESLRSYVLWGMGSFAEANIQEALLISVLVIVALLLLIPFLPALNIFLLGENYALNLGVRVKRLRWIMIAITGAVSGVITAFCGPISFVGLAVPHFARITFKTADHKTLFFPIILIGSITGSLSDILSRSLEIPLNAVTSAIGAPVVIFILLQYAKEKNYFG